MESNRPPPTFQLGYRFFRWPGRNLSLMVTASHLSVIMVPCREERGSRGQTMAIKEEWAYDFETLARITGLKRNTLVQFRRRGLFDPARLESVLLFIARYGPRELRIDLVTQALSKESEITTTRERSRASRPRRKAT